jgi:pimeloyl-[acyl-carrier protein] methyl ester esterase
MKPLVPLVLVPGWGMRRSVFDRLTDALSPLTEVRAVSLPGYPGSHAPAVGDIDATARSLAAAAPERCAVLGWSLGAQVAAAWARSAPRQVEKLVLVSATPSFVRRDDWHAAVDAHVLHEFAHALEDDAARTLNRFVLLQARGDADERDLARALRAHVAAVDPSTLKHGLDLLRATDLRRMLPEIAQETLLIHGERDRLTPLEAAEYLASHLPRAALTVFGGAAHAPFVSRAAEVARAIRELLE